MNVYVCVWCVRHVWVLGGGMGVCVWYMCGVMCEGYTYVCVCTDKSPKATTFWFPAVPVFPTLSLFLSLTFLWSHSLEGPAQPQVALQ